SKMPTVMPLAAAVSPRFSDRYPEAAIVFDNLHSLHDVVADILASPLIAAGDKRSAILRAIRTFQDSTTQIISREEWRSMAREMGSVLDHVLDRCATEVGEEPSHEEWILATVEENERDGGDRGIHNG